MPRKKYEVELVLDRRVEDDGSFSFLTKWKGKKWEGKDSWEPISSFGVDAIKQVKTLERILDHKIPKPEWRVEYEAKKEAEEKAKATTPKTTPRTANQSARKATGASSSSTPKRGACAPAPDAVDTDPKRGRATRAATQPAKTTKRGGSTGASAAQSPSPNLRSGRATASCQKAEDEDEAGDATAGRTPTTSRKLPPSAPLDDAPTSGPSAKKLRTTIGAGASTSSTQKSNGSTAPATRMIGKPPFSYSPSTRPYVAHRPAKIPPAKKQRLVDPNPNAATSTPAASRPSTGSPAKQVRFVDPAAGPATPIQRPVKAAADDRAGDGSGVQKGKHARTKAGDTVDAPSTSREDGQETSDDGRKDESSGSVLGKRPSDQQSTSHENNGNEHEQPESKSGSDSGTEEESVRTTVTFEADPVANNPQPVWSLSTGREDHVLSFTQRCRYGDHVRNLSNSEVTTGTLSTLWENLLRQIMLNSADQQAIARIINEERQPSAIQLIYLSVPYASPEGPRRVFLSEPTNLHMLRSWVRSILGKLGICPNAVGVDEQLHCPGCIDMTSTL